MPNAPDATDSTVKAMWNGAVLAQSDATIVVDGHRYFPREALRWEHLVESGHRTECVWKGVAYYYHVRVEGKVNENAAWCYREPLPAVKDIAGYVAFWQGVEVGPV